jgi:APA family basic amino acid/polyamine antiporter
MLGAVLATGALIALFAVLSNKVFGNEFQGAIAFNSLGGLTNGSTEAATGAAPYFTVLAGILTNNVVLSVIIMAMFVAWIWFWIPAELAYTTRSMIAWSFDRLAPDRLGYVSRRFNTPVVAIGLSLVISLVFMWLIAYRNTSLLTLVEALLVIWGTAMAAAIVFPWARRRFYERSPAASWTVAGFPLMAITGVLSVAFFILAFVLLWRDKIAAGPLIDTGAASFWLVVGTLVGATAWYLGVKLYRRRQGVDVDLAFREIPIE